MKKIMCHMESNNKFNNHNNIQIKMKKIIKIKKIRTVKRNFNQINII